MATNEKSNLEIVSGIEDFPPLICVGPNLSNANARSRDKEVCSSEERNKESENSQEETQDKGQGSEIPQNKVKSGGCWRDLFTATTAVCHQDPWIFTPPAVVKGKRMVAASTCSIGSSWCDKLVIGYFVGKGLSFSAVKSATAKHWKIKKEASIRGYGNGAFIFEFADDEDRNQVLEMAPFYISSKLFTVRPWSPMIEKSVTDIKSVPIWVCIFGVPLHMWDVEGLGLIASFLGKPILADECTIKKTRLSFARICIEIDIDFDFPLSIPLLVDDDKVFELPVEYQWKPQKCVNCRVFGHETKVCARIAKSKWIPKERMLKSGLEKEVEVMGNHKGSEPMEEIVAELEVREGQSVQPNLEQNLPSELTGTEEVIRIEEKSGTQKISKIADGKKGQHKQEKSNLKEVVVRGEKAGIEPNIAEATVNKALLHGKIGNGAGLGGGTVSGSTFAIVPGTNQMVMVTNSAGIGAKVTGAVIGTGPNQKAAGSGDTGSKAPQTLTGSKASLDQIKQNSTADPEGEWKTVKSKSQIRISPKRNPFMVLSDFKSESRFPINRKLEDEEFERNFKHLSEEQKRVKKQEREKKRLMWDATPDKGGASPGGGTRSQNRKK